MKLAWHVTQPDIRGWMTISLFARKSGPRNLFLHAEMLEIAYSTFVGRFYRRNCPNNRQTSIFAATAKLMMPTGNRKSWADEKASVC